MNRGTPYWDKTVMFGKFAGRKYSEVPTEYLEWFAKNAYPQMVNRQSWAVRELRRRQLLQEKNPQD